MRRSIRLALIAMPLIAVACGEDQSTTPTPPHLYVANASTITQQITDLYPEYLGHRDAALSKWRSLQDAIAKDKPSVRMKLMHLIDWTLKREKEGVLLDPNGSDAPSTRVAVSILTASLFQAAYPDAPAPPIAAEGVDIGAAVVEPTMPTIIVTEQSQAGGEFQAGTWTEPVLVTFTELPDPSPGGSGPLPAGSLTQYPKFYQITAFPNDPTLKDIRIGICHVTDPQSPYFPPEPHTQLRVAKTKEVGEGTELLILNRVEVADFLNCVDVSAEGPILGSASAGGLGGYALRTVGKAMKGLASIITPKSLYAIDQGIGGVLEKTIDDVEGGEEPTGAFSTFGLVDVNTQIAACATPVAGYTTYPTVAQAVAATTSGGTTFICGGTYLVNDLSIDKPITIRRIPGANVIIENVAPATGSFLVNAVPSGTVRITGLHFITTSGSSVVARLQYDQVLLDSNSYALSGGAAAAGVDLEASSVPAAKVTVRNSTFSGGYWGAFARGDAAMDVFNSTFANQVYSNIQHQYGSRGRVQYNTITECGYQACIRGLRAAALEIFDNNIQVSLANPVQYGIEADTGAVAIQRNNIMGYGAQPSGETVMSTDSTDYPMFQAGIAVGRLASAVTVANVSNNRIQGAHRGISVGSGIVNGADNVIDSTMVALEIRFASNVTLGSSDILTYARPFAISGTAAASLICNYWGSAAGPHNPPLAVPSSFYTPWATSPVANGAGGTCYGGPGLDEGFIGSVDVP